MLTTADNRTTRLLKTKMFVEQLVVRRKIGGSPGSWEPPISQSTPIDQAINNWVDQTGNEIVTVSAPSMFMQWMDSERTTRLVVCTVMLTYIPSVPPPKVDKEQDVKQRVVSQGREWESV